MIGKYGVHGIRVHFALCYNGKIYPIMKGEMKRKMNNVSFRFW